MNAIITLVRTLFARRFMVFATLIAGLTGLLSALALMSLAGMMITSLGWQIPGLTLSALWFMRLLSLSRTLGRYVERLLGHDLILKFQATLRAGLFSALMRKPYWALPRASADDFGQRFTGDVEAIELLFLRSFLPIVLLGFAFLAGFFTLLLLNPIIAMLWLVWFILFTLLSWRIVKQSWKAGEKASVTARNLGEDCAAAFAALNDIRALGQQEQVAHTLALRHSDKIKAEITLSQSADNSDLYSTLLLGVMPLSAFFLSVDTPQSLSAALVLLFLSLALNEVMQPLARALSHFGKAISAAARLPTPQEPQPGKHKPLATLDIQSGKVQTPDKRLLLEGLDIKVEQGQSLAIMGPSGIGKSTLLTQLAGLETSAEPRAFYVSQEAGLFAGTLQDNLDFARLNDKKSLKEALHTVEIGNLAEDLQLWIGDGGRTLSSGQTRRISLARALLSPLPVVLLDEPVEHLDVDQRLRVLDRLLTALKKKNKAIVFTTHRTQESLLADNRLLLNSPHTVPSLPPRSCISP